MTNWVDCVGGIVPKLSGVESNSLGGKKQVSGTKISLAVFRVLQNALSEFVIIFNSK